MIDHPTGVRTLGWLGRRWPSVFEAGWAIESRPRKRIRDEYGGLQSLLLAVLDARLSSLLYVSCWSIIDAVGTGCLGMEIVEAGFQSNRLQHECDNSSKGDSIKCETCTHERRVIQDNTVSQLQVSRQEPVRLETGQTKQTKPNQTIPRPDMTFLHAPQAVFTVSLSGDGGPVSAFSDPAVGAPPVFAPSCFWEK